MEFNQDKSLITIYRDDEVKILTVEPFILRSVINISKPKIVRMFYRTNLIFFVGNDNIEETKDKHYPGNILNIFDDSQQEVIDKIKLNAEIDDIQCNKFYISLLSENNLYLYKFDDLKIPYYKTNIVNKNFCLTDNYLIYIDKSYTEPNVETVNIKNLSNDKTIEIKAHQNKIKFMSINKDETLLATASERGTIIRIFDIVGGTKLYEFRRGTNISNIQYIVFSEDSQFIAVISDRGTIHIYNLKNINANRKSMLSMLSVISGYFDSDWSFAWYFDETINKTKKCCFNNNNDLLIISESNNCQKLSFDKNNGGLCILKDNVQQ